MAKEKEQLEKELKFLKESFESDIISEEEYKNKKESIEIKLKDLEEKKTEETEQEEKKEHKKKKEKNDKKAMQSTSGGYGKHEGKEEAEETEETKEEIKIEEIKQEKLREVEEKEQEMEEKKEQENEETEEETKEEEHEVEEEIEELQEKKPKKKTKLIIFAVIVVIVFLVFYFYAFKGANKEAEDKESPAGFMPECISDSDCEMQGKSGVCLNPNTTEAVCEFKEDKETSLIIINDENCVSCDTARMLEVIKKLFPLVKKTNVSSNSEEGKKLISQLGLEALPAYIFEPDVKDTLNFEKFKRALAEKEDRFIINPAASGSNYYFKRKVTANKLDLFVLPTAPDIENNAADVLKLFGDNINYSKHVVLNESEEKRLYDELGITTYPSFLINNQVKFSGIQSAESIKNKFCELNKIPGCETKLSSSLK